MLQRQKRFYTAAEYLALEEIALDRSEYYNGEIFAMAGGSLNHNRIAGNLYAILNRFLADKPGQAFIGDIKVFVKAHRLYTYPDVMVICGKPTFAEDRTDTVTNPQVIVEVLSKLTQDYDRDKKFKFYRALDTFQAYVLIDQTQPHLQYYRKLADGQWVLTELRQLTDTLLLESRGCEIPLNQIYHKVDWL